MTVRVRSKGGSYLILSNDEFVDFAIRGEIDGIDPDRVFITALDPSGTPRRMLQGLADEIKKQCPTGNGEVN